MVKLLLIQIRTESAAFGEKETPENKSTAGFTTQKLPH